jgi:hypothetical protein
MKPSFNNRNFDEQIKLANVSLSSEVKDYSNDPTFLKRAQEAKEFLEKVGFPEELLKIRDDMYGPEEKDYDFDIKSYHFSPAAIKKAGEAKRFMEEHPIPKELLELIGVQHDKK